ncbi:MAG: hypothetical protein WCT06_01215 [Armatimonadota bacterium]
MFRYFIYIAVFCLGLGAVMPAVAGNVVKLECKFKAGEVLRYKVESDAEITVNIPGIVQLPPIPVKMSASLVQKTNSILSDGSADISASAESFKLELNGSIQDIPQEQMPVLRLIVSKNGEIKEVKGLENAAPTIPGMQLSAISALCRFGGFPSGEIAPGDSWKANFPFVLGKGSIAVLCKLESLKEQGQSACYSQVGAGDVELALPFGMDAGSMAKTVKGPVQCLGKVVFSPALGRVVMSEGAIDMKFTMPEYASAGNPGESTVKLKYKIDLFP